MEQKRRRPSNRAGSGNSNSTRNVRSITNSREVSRRTKGKDRYAQEEGRSERSRFYDDDDYLMAPTRRSEKTSSRGTGRPKNNDMKKAKKRDSYDSGSRGSRRRRGRRKNGFSKILGVILTIFQFILSAVLVVNVLFFNMLPTTYILVLVGVLVILLGITMLTQLGAKGKGIGGKLFCMLMCVILGAGSFYISKGNNAFQNIANGKTKTNAMVVVVLKDNKAEKIVDAADYKFAIQYANEPEQVTSAVTEIEKEIGNSIETEEYNSLPEEAQALIDGEVDAMIFSAAQASIIEDQIEKFSDKTKEIYRHNIVVSIESSSVDASMNEVFAIYLSGIDTYGDITANSRSDVNIIAIVNPKSHQVLLVTTPRDYYIPIPGISKGQEDKLTHAGTYGIDASMRTLAELYDIDIPFFGRVNFTSMINIVDALGGLDVESDQEFETGWESGVEIQINEGMNHFNGEEALAFCRERHALEDGDNARGRHQQAVITAIINKMMSPAMLRGATDIIDTVSDGVETNFTTEQIQALIKTQLRTNAKWSVHSVSAEGFGDKQACFSSGDQLLYVTVPDETSVANIVEKINKVEKGEAIQDNPVDGDTTSDYDDTLE